MQNLKKCQCAFIANTYHRQRTVYSVLGVFGDCIVTSGVLLLPKLGVITNRGVTGTGVAAGTTGVTVTGAAFEKVFAFVLVFAFEILPVII
jgi:hypothetical protein